jgi:RHS repeat-associated protein
MKTRSADRMDIRMKTTRLFRSIFVAALGFCSLVAEGQAVTPRETADLKARVLQAHRQGALRLERSRSDFAGLFIDPERRARYERAKAELADRRDRLIGEIDALSARAGAGSRERLDAIGSFIDGRASRMERSGAPAKRSPAPGTGLAVGPKDFPVPVPADLAATVDAPQTPEIQALAESLGRNPVAIFNWVRANVGFVPTVGSVQGAAGALSTRIANASDTASLLVALLRSSGVPARYVVGTIEVEAYRLRAWLGGVSSTAAAIDLLLQGGVAHEIVTQAGEITAVRLEHVWVHAWVDAVASRGAVNRQGDAWLELDAAFKAVQVRDGVDLIAHAQLQDPSAAAAAVSAAASLGADTVNGLDASAIQARLAATQASLSGSLAAAGLGNATLGELIGTRSVVAPAWSLLPLSLPAKTVSQSPPVADLGAGARHSLSLRLFRTELDRLQGNALLSFERPAVEIQGQVLALRYVPATAADVATLVALLPSGIAAASALPRAIPGYLVEMKAELWLGESKVAESAPIRMGESLSAEFRHQGLGTDLDQQVFTSVAGETRVLVWDLASRLAPRLEALAARMRATQGAAGPTAGALAIDPLATLALGYFATHDLYSALSAGVNQVHAERLPSLGAVHTWLEPELNLGVPSQVHLAGLALAEPVHQSLAVPAKASGDVPRFRWQALNLSSTLGHVLPEFAGATPGVSAVRVLADALAAASPVASITLANRARLDTLGLEAQLRARIDAAVNAGRRASVNAADVARPDWNGRAALLEDASRDGQSFVRGGTWQVQSVLGGNRADIGVGIAWASLLPDAERTRLAAIQAEITGPVVALADSVRAIASDPASQRATPQTLAVIAGHVLDRAVGPRVGPLLDAHLWAGLLLPHVRVNLLAEAQAPSVTLTLTPDSLAIGADTLVQASATDNVGVTELKVSADGQPLALVGGQATYTPARAGAIPFVATARDAAGNFAEVRRTLTVTDAGDTTPPAVAILSPADGEELSGVTPIVGTASDSSFLDYVVRLSPTGESRWRVLGTGAAPATNTQLAAFDPSTIPNGLYDIQLVARDTNGRETSVQISVVVKGELKVGQFALTFRDLEVEASGIPITVHRTYDTRRRGESLDFGYGWSVDYQDVKIQSNGVAGQGWQLVSVGSGLSRQLCPRPLGAKVVTVRLPDGKMERFDVGVSPDCKLATDIASNPDFLPAFTPRSGTSSALATSAGPLRVSGNVLLDMGSGEAYDPSRFQLTTENRFVYQLDKALGIRAVSDPDGNTLTFSSAGISHSAGKSIAFTRDAAGRITAITDPEGRRITYGYTPAGDLVSVTDRMNLVASHTYDANHGLTGYTDPRGTLLMRSEYDADGRVMRQVDAAGNAIDFTRDLANRRESVRDRRGNLTAYDYDAQGNVTRVTDAAGGITQYTYDANGYEASKTDPNGSTTARSYDVFGKVLTETDPGGRTTTFTYDASGNLKTYADPLGRVTESGYSLTGQLTSLKDAAGRTTAFAYLTTGNLASITDAAGKVTAYVYDGAGNRTQETDAAGGVTLFAYDGSGRETSRTQRRTVGAALQSFTATRTLDANGRVLAETDPLGGTSRTEYDGLGKPVRTIDPLGRITTHDYDSRGHLIRTTFPDGQFELIGYDAEGNETSRTDARGSTTTNTHDALGRLTRVTNPDGSFVASEYDPGGRVVATVDENGRRTAHEYDPAGRRTATVDAAGGRTEFTYDAVGNLLTVRDALGNTTTHAYDALNRRTRTTYPDAKFVAFEYDALGRKTKETDAENRATSFTYDGVGRLASVTDAVFGVTSYGYDEVGNKIRQTDANSRVTRWEYDHLGRVTKRILPLAQEESFTYDLAGNRASRTDFLGRTTSYEYDALNRLLWKRLPGGAVVGYTYSATGQVASVTDGRGTTTHAYDARDRLSRVTQPDGTALEYGYDAAGNRTSVKVITGATSRTTTYAYDALNRLSSVTDPAGRTTSWTYDAAGNRKTQTLPNGVVSTWGYDSRNRLTAIEHRKADASLIASYAYTLSGTGQRSQVVETTPAGTRTVAYTYDALYRLTGETVTAGAATTTTLYQYDSTGNRTRVTVNGVVSSYFYDQNDRMYFEGNNAVAFDANGNMLGLPSKAATYAYDPEDRLTRATHTAGPTVDYAYDGEGARIETKVTQGATVATTRHLIDKNRAYAEVIEERDEAGNLTALYTHGHDLEGPISQERFVAGAGTVSYYLTDHLGSTRFLVDSSGNVTDSYLYEPYGTVSQRTGTTPNSYQFTGEQFDQATGMKYLRARWLANGIARFVTLDRHTGSAQDPLTLNDYTYASANPATYRDPSGLFVGLAPAPMLNLAALQGSLAILRSVAVAAGGQMARQTGSRAAVRFGAAVRAKALSTIVTLARECMKSGQWLAQDCGGRENVFLLGDDFPQHRSFVEWAIGSGAQNVLTRRSPVPKDRSWLSSKFGCQGSKLLKIDCDEFPYAASHQGGKENFDTVYVTLNYSADNQGAGFALLSFFTNCRIQGGPQTGDKFTVIPAYGTPTIKTICRR